MEYAAVVVRSISDNAGVAGYDPRILQAIYARAQQVTDPSKRNRYLRAALQTGIVESGIQNLNHGDADSLGWRQERASIYKNPTNITASVDRFFNEAQELDRGQKSWELAADVQRPAAQYRGRYKDVAKDAAGLLRSLGGGGSGGSSSPSMPSLPGAAPIPGLPQIEDAGQAGDFTSLLASLIKPQQQAPQSAPIVPPEFSSAQVMPQGFRPLTPDSRPEPPAQGGVSGVLGLLETLRGSGPTVTTPEAAQTAGGVSVPIADKVTNERAGKVTLPKSGKNNWGVLDYVGQSGKYIQQTYGVKEIGGYRANDPFPDHPSRKALDLMVYNDREKGDAIAADLVRNYKQHKIKYIIWQQRIWHPGKGWRKMEDRGSPTQNHEDHVHALYK